MNASLVISGYALYVFFGLFAILVLGFVFYGCAYVKEARAREKLERKCNKLRKGCEKVMEEYRKMTFKVPSIDTEGKNV